MQRVKEVKPTQGGNGIANENVGQKNIGFSFELSFTEEFDAIFFVQNFMKMIPMVGKDKWN